MELKAEHNPAHEVSCHCCPYNHTSCVCACPTVGALFNKLDDDTWQDRFKKEYCND